MKRWAWILGAVLLLLCGNTGGARLEDLKPAELLCLSRQGGYVTVETDTGDRGTGKTVQKAIQNLQESSDGVILLETVDQLVVMQKAAEDLPGIAACLRPAAEVCLGSGLLDLRAVSDYLRIHRPGVTLLDLETGKKELLRLKGEKGRYILE